MASQLTGQEFLVDISQVSGILTHLALTVGFGRRGLCASKFAGLLLLLPVLVVEPLAHIDEDLDFVVF